MNCRKCTSLLSSYLDERTSAARRADIDEHLASCSSCAQQLRTMRRLSSALAAGDGAPPPELADRLTRVALAAGRDVDEPGFLDRWIRVAWPSAAATAAAAAAFAIAVTSSGTNVEPDDAGGDPVAMVAADDDIDVTADVLGLEED